MKIINQSLLILLSMFAISSCNRNEAKSGFDQYLLVGTYTAKDSKGINIYKFNSKTGDSEFVRELEIDNPSYLAISEDEKYVYAVSESGEENSQVTAFSFDKTMGQLTKLNSQKTDADPCHIAVDKSNRLLLVANYSGGSVSEYSVNKDGSIAPIKIQRFEGKGTDPDRQEKAHLHQITFSPGQHFVYANDLGNDKIYKFLVSETEDQKLILSAPSEQTIQSGAGPRHSTFHPNGKFLYTLSELSGEVFVFDYNINNGELTSIQTIVADTLNAEGSADIHITPNGKFLYTSNRLKGDGITIFSIDEKSGELTKRGYQETGKHPRNFIVTPDGNFLLVANRDTDNIQIFKIEENGLLTDINKDIKLSMPVCLKLASID